MDRPRLTRRALGALSLTTATAVTATSCGPDDEGFGTKDRISATDDEIPLKDLPENTTTLVNFGGQQPYVALVRGDGDDVSAMSGYCTHQGCAVALSEDGKELDCPCHGSRFDARTGDALGGPAPRGLPEVDVETDGDKVRRVR